MYKAVYQLESIGKFSTLAEAFKVIYDAIKKEKTLSWQVLETTICIEADDRIMPYSFYEARDLMCQAGHLVDGKWIESGTPAESRHGREPDKVKPLAQYLAEYFDYELRNGSDYHSYCELFEQALDAYESTEQVKIRIERV